jgi:hypothetical protein
MQVTLERTQCQLFNLFTADLQGTQHSNQATNTVWHLAQHMVNFNLCVFIYENWHGP